MMACKISTKAYICFQVLKIGGVSFSSVGVVIECFFVKIAFDIGNAVFLTVINGLAKKNEHFLKKRALNPAFWFLFSGKTALNADHLQWHGALGYLRAS